MEITITLLLVAAIVYMAARYEREKREDAEFANNERGRNDN